VLAFLFVQSTVLFGVVLHGLAAFLVLLAVSVLSGFAAVLIYRRDFVGWALALFNAIFGIANMFITFAGHDMLQIYREMGLNEQQLQSFQQFPQMPRMIWLMTLPVTIVYLALLLYTKRFFPRAGTSTPPSSLSS
jgi:ABC-type microcin C transport system permease subunit YejB